MHRAREEERTAQPISGGQGRKKALGSRGAKAPPGRMGKPGSQEQALAWEPGQERAPSQGPREWGAGGSTGGLPGPTYLSRGSWLLSSSGRRGMAAERGLGL